MSIPELSGADTETQPSGNGSVSDASLDGGSVGSGESAEDDSNPTEGGSTDDDSTGDSGPARCDDSAGEFVFPNDGSGLLIRAIDAVELPSGEMLVAIATERGVSLVNGCGEVLWEHNANYSRVLLEPPSNDHIAIVGLEASTTPGAFGAIERHHLELTTWRSSGANSSSQSGMIAMALGKVAGRSEINLVGIHTDGKTSPSFLLLHHRYPASAESSGEGVEITFSGDTTPIAEISRRPWSMAASPSGEFIAVTAFSDEDVPHSFFVGSSEKFAIATMGDPTLSQVAFVPPEAIANISGLSAFVWTTPSPPLGMLGAIIPVARSGGDPWATFHEPSSAPPHDPQYAAVVQDQGFLQTLEAGAALETTIHQMRLSGARVMQDDPPEAETTPLITVRLPTVPFAVTENHLVFVEPAMTSDLRVRAIGWSPLKR